MSTGEKSDHIPPSYVDSAGHPFAPGPVTGYEGQRPAQYPAPTQVAYPPAPATAYPAPPAYPYPQQQQAASVVVVGGAPANQNVLVVQTVRANVQIPDVYPGLAFCQFVPGMLETFIRSATAVMLLVLVILAAVTIEEEGEVIYDNGVIVDATGWRGATGWIIFVAGLTLITEGIMLLLRFLNPKCFNNSYGVFGGLDITKCILAGIGLFIGCIITGVESNLAGDDLERYCDNELFNPDNNRACEQIQKIYRLVVALTAINAFCMFLILFLFVWDIVYLSAGFNSKVPVPRGTEQLQ